MIRFVRNSPWSEFVVNKSTKDRNDPSLCLEDILIESRKREDARFPRHTAFRPRSDSNPISSPLGSVHSAPLRHSASPRAPLLQGQDQVAVQQHHSAHDHPFPPMEMTGDWAYRNAMQTLPVQRMNTFPAYYSDGLYGEDRRVPLNNPAMAQNFWLPEDMILTNTS